MHLHVEIGYELEKLKVSATTHLSFMPGIILTAVKGNESDCNGGTCKKFSLTAEEVFDIQNNPDIIKFITEELQRQLAANPNMDNMIINTNIIPVLSDSKPTMSYATLGCFRDKWSRAIPGVDNKYSALMDNYHQRVNAIEKCAKVAASEGYRVFAVQDGGR
uniref:uncharacterized protein LOC120326006 isoform X1 n=1 Tax=Styela clava TaxID=7725 RepID=UPI001939B2C3|nr:uncharacterized protein LOC120326006 isoform X1 [Styela clava]